MVWLFVMFSFFWWSFFIFAGKDTSTDWNVSQWGWWNTTATSASEIGLNLQWGCLTWMWKWCFEYDKIIWIASMKSGKTTAKTLSQDIVLAATYMVGTVLTIIIIYCGLWFILASRDGKDVNKYKKWLINAAIWALLVWWAYAIVRLIQYIAKW